MKWLLAVLIVACQPVEAVEPTPVVTPTPVVIYVTPTPGPTPFVYPVLDPRNVVVSLTADPAAAEALGVVLAEAPAAWARATLGRSHLTFEAKSLAPIYIALTNRTSDRGNIPIAGIKTNLAGGRIQVITVYQVHRDELVLTVLHELGHALGCCVGNEANGGHWTACVDEIMCHGMSRETFSDRELRQMGLAD